MTDLSDKTRGNLRAHVHITFLPQPRNRPLTAEQLQYAALDAWVLLLGLEALGQTIQNAQGLRPVCRAQQSKELQDLELHACSLANLVFEAQSRKR